MGVGGSSPLASTKKSCSTEQDLFCRYRTLHERSEYKTHKSVILVTTCFYHKCQVKRLGIFYFIEPPTPTLFYLGVGDYAIVFHQSLGVGANAPRASPLAYTKKSCSTEQDFFCRYRTTNPTLFYLGVGDHAMKSALRQVKLGGFDFI